MCAFKCEEESSPTPAPAPVPAPVVEFQLQIPLPSTVCRSICFGLMKWPGKWDAGRLLVKLNEYLKSQAGRNEWFASRKTYVRTRKAKTPAEMELLRQGAIWRYKRYFSIESIIWALFKFSPRHMCVHLRWRWVSDGRWNGLPRKPFRISFFGLFVVDSCLHLSETIFRDWRQVIVPCFEPLSTLYPPVISSPPSDVVHH